MQNARASISCLINTLIFKNEEIEGKIKYHKDSLESLKESLIQNKQMILEYKEVLERIKEDSITE